MKSHFRIECAFRLQPADMQEIKTSLQDQILSRICVMLEEMLGVVLTPHQSFMEAGLDSLGAMDLHKTLCASFECELPATIAFDFPNALALARYIASILDVQEVRVSEPTSYG